MNIQKENKRRISIAHNHDRAEANWKHSVQKTKAVGFFATKMSKKCVIRQTLLDFVQRMKTQKYTDTPELNTAKQGYETEDKIQTLRPKSPEQSDAVKKEKLSKPETPTWKLYEIKPGCKCALCNNRFEVFHEHEAIPCRVCNDVFHRNCLETCSDLHSSDKCNIDMAKTNTGWSCPDCANISLLLNEDEIAKLTLDFEKVDINQDGSISLAEYLRFNTRRQSIINHKGELVTNERAHLINEFRLMDQNGDGMLDWWEFTNHECKAILARKDKHELVNMLTEKEQITAKATFSMFDTDGDGKIKEHAVIKVYQDKFDKLRRLESVSKLEQEMGSLDVHATSAVQSMMSADTSKEGAVTWADYILDQALYIICSRPNINTAQFSCLSL